MVIAVLMHLNTKLNNPSLIGYEPVGLTMNPDPQNDRGWVLFIAWVSSAKKKILKDKVYFEGDIKIRKFLFFIFTKTQFSLTFHYMIHI